MNKCKSTEGESEKGRMNWRRRGSEKSGWEEGKRKLESGGRRRGRGIVGKFEERSKVLEETVIEFFLSFPPLNIDRLPPLLIRS